MLRVIHPNLLQQFQIKRTKEIFESVDKQHFQKFPWFGHERKAL